MLVKYNKQECIKIEDMHLYDVEPYVFEKLNELYPFDNVTIESMELSGNRYYDTDRGDLFDGNVVVLLSQTLPYGQKPSDWFNFDFKY